MRMWRKHIVTKFWKLSKAIVIDVVVVVVHSKHIKGHKTTNTAIAAASSSVNAVTLKEEDQGKYVGTFFMKTPFDDKRSATTWQHGKVCEGIFVCHFLLQIIMKKCIGELDI